MTKPNGTPDPNRVTNIDPRFGGIHRNDAAVKARAHALRVQFLDLALGDSSELRNLVQQAFHDKGLSQDLRKIAFSEIDDTALVGTSQSRLALRLDRVLKPYGFTVTYDHTKLEPGLHKVDESPALHDQPESLDAHLIQIAEVDPKFLLERILRFALEEYGFVITDKANEPASAEQSSAGTPEPSRSCCSNADPAHEACTG